MTRDYERHLREGGAPFDGRFPWATIHDAVDGYQAVIRDQQAEIESLRNALNAALEGEKP